MAETTSIVIFGGSGDLAQRKLIPSLLNLFCKNQLPDDFNVVGLARIEFSDETFREFMHEAVQKYAPAKYNSTLWESFASRLWYVTGSFEEADDYVALKEKLNTLEDGSADRLYYLATAPRFFPVIAKQLGQAGMARAEGAARRLVVEKPFGDDLASAQALNTPLYEVFDEQQIFRIDHYVAPAGVHGGVHGERTLRRVYATNSGSGD